VLTALADLGVRLDHVAGSSLGGVLGAMYAIEPNAAALRERAVGYFAKSPLFGRDPKPARDDGLKREPTLLGRVGKFAWTLGLANWLACRRSLFRRNIAFRAIDDLVADIDIGATALPFACTALDLTAGRPAIFRSGRLRDALKAGTSVGVIFRPYAWQGIEYVDAAPISSVPVRACRGLGAERVIAVDIRAPLSPGFRTRDGFDVISRIETVESTLLNDAEVAEADLVLRPDVSSIFWGDFTRVNDAVAAGEAAVRSAAEKIRALLC